MFYLHRALKFAVEQNIPVFIINCIVDRCFNSNSYIDSGLRDCKLVYRRDSTTVEVLRQFCHSPREKLSPKCKFIIQFSTTFHQTWSLCLYLTCK